MEYRTFGKTGLKPSIIGMGGMRFDRDAIARGDLDSCAEVMVHAYKKGVNYFDTAPNYCNDKSLEIFALGIRQMEREKVFITSKASPENTGEQTSDDILRAIEQQLKRLDSSYIDFFHLWCVLSFDMFCRYEKMGIISGILKAKERGLVRHVTLSTHASGDEIAKILESGYFEGCLLNYNATNFAFRQKGLDAAARMGIGVVTMNPLGGGLIPGNPDYYAFLKNGSTDTVAKAAVRFNASHPQINVVLVGATQKEHIDEAIEAVDDLKPITTGELERLKAHITENLNSLCTMCGYCEKHCPASLPIPKLMDAYNQYLLDQRSAKTLAGRLEMHWDIPWQLAGDCIGCGACESRCTQHLPIIERMKEIYQTVDTLHN